MVFYLIQLVIEKSLRLGTRAFAQFRLAHGPGSTLAVVRVVAESVSKHLRRLEEGSLLLVGFSFQSTRNNKPLHRGVGAQKAGGDGRQKVDDQNCNQGAAQSQ